MDIHFRSALFKLTAWYMLIIAVLCIGFSFIIFALSSAEFDRRLPPDPNVSISRQPSADILEDIRAQRASESRSRLAASLLVVNAFALTLGGFGSYLLARRTLRPIQEASRAQGRFISDASHELRTPLAVMQSEIEVALRGKPSPSELETLAASNLEEVNRLRELSDRLLQLNSGADIPLSTISIEDAMIDAATPCLKRAEERSIELVNKVDGSQAFANQESLKDVLSILIDNAIKYSPDNTAITLSSTTRGRSVYVNVSDNGRGITESDLPFIFDRFYRADTSRTAQDVKGNGLGLSIAKQIVDKMNGELLVRSTLGKGSTFTVKLDAPKTPRV